METTNQYLKSIYTFDSKIRARIAVLLQIIFGSCAVLLAIQCQGIKQNALKNVSSGHSVSVVSRQDTPQLIPPIGHIARITSVAFSPDGRYALSGSWDNTLKLWEVSTGREVRSFSGHSSWVNSVAFSPDGRYALSGSGDMTLKLWEVATGKEIRSFSGHTNTVYSVAFSPDGRYIISGSWDMTLKLWDVTTGKEVRSFYGHTNKVYSVAFSPDGNYALSSSEDGTLKLWEVPTGREIRSFLVHLQPTVRYEEPRDYCPSAVFSPDGRYALSGCSDKTLKLWEVATGQEVRSFSGHTGVVWSVVFSPDGCYALSGSWDKTLKLWDVSTGKEIRSFSGHTDEVSSVAFSPDGNYALSSSEDGTLKLWVMATGQEVRSFSGHTNWINSVAFSPDGRYALSGSRDNTLKLWDVASGLGVRSFSGHTDHVTLVAFSPDGRYALSGSDDNTLKLWDVDTGREIRSFSGHTGYVNSVAFSPDGRFALSGSYGILRLWDVSTGKEVRSFSGYKMFDSVISVAFSPDGRYALTGSDNTGSADNTLKLWDVFTGREIRSFSINTGVVTSITFSPDGRYAISHSWDKPLKLWNMSTGKEMRSFSGYMNWVNSVAFSPDGRYVLSGSKDNTLKLWDVATGRELCSFPGHTQSVTSVAFSPDGRHALSSSEDNTLKLWDVATGNLLLTRLHIDGDEYMIITPDNYYTASKGALRWVSFEIGNRVFPFEQFDLRFNRPDIILERLGKASPGTIASYKRLYQKRLRKIRFTEEMLGSDFHIPEVTLLSKDIPISTTSRSFAFKIRAVDSKYLLDRINVYINDVPIYGVAGISLSSKKVQSVEQDIKVTLANGDNKIQISALNEKGAESLKETFYVLYNGPSTKPNLYLIAIGVSNYQDRRYSLDYTVSDATNIGSLFARKEGYHFGKVHIQYLLDNDASKENIIAAKKFFQQSHVDDMAMVFVAGHGLVDSEYNYYFGTYDVDHTNPALRGLPYEEVDNLLDGIPARKKVLFLDTCYSGEIEKSEVQLVSADPVDMNIRGTIRKRAFSRSLAVTERILDNAVMIQQDMFADLRRGTGAVVISSSAGGEYSFESSDWKGGVFTYAVIEGLREKKADRNDDTQIQVSELQAYVLDRVKQLTAGEQHPTVRQENLADDFVVY